MKELILILSLLLLVCLFDMPYGYYMFVRYVAAILFGVWGYNCLQEQNKNWGILFISLAVLFQPIVKISLGRTIWNIVDVGVVVLLIIFYIRMNKNKS
jgi:hypothetical protein